MNTSDLNVQDVVDFLREKGHFKNPVVKRFGEVAEDEWGHLSLNDPRVQAALASYQEFFRIDLDEFTIERHGRSAIADGDLGPATMDLLQMPRCACPDYEDESAMAATGSGSWRAGCYADHPGIHAVKFHVDLSRCPYKNWWDEVQETVMNAYAEIGMKLIPVTSKGQSQVSVRWEVLAGSTIGLAQLPGSGRCGGQYFCKLDPGYRPNANQIMQLWAHELGHNMNSGHISGDPIMHPSMRNKNWKGSFVGTAFGRRLVSFFGGDDLRDKPEPPPGPGPSPSNPFKDVAMKLRHPITNKWTEVYVIPKTDLGGL